MVKKLYSGNVYMGTCGEVTELFDSFGEKLFVGDLVAVYSNDIPTKEIHVTDPEYVVFPHDKFPFIMGLKSCERKTHYYRDGEESTENLYDYQEDVYESTENPKFQWLVKKVKDWQRTVDGEVWGSGNITVRLEEKS